MKRLWGALLGAVLLSGCEPHPLPAPIQFERASADQVTNGKRLATVLGCRGCHDKNLQGRDWSDPLGRLWTANLTRTTEQLDDDQLRRLLVTGARPDRPLWGMPSHLFTRLSASDTASLLAYLRSVPTGGPVHPPPTFGPEARRLVAAGVWRSSARDVAEQGGLMPPAAGAEHLRGRYIVRATCAECHGMDLKGGRPDPSAKPRPDLRMVAAYSLPDFRTLLRSGKAVGNREVGLMSEVARGRYSHFTDAEIEAVHSYLQAVAATDPS